MKVKDDGTVKVLEFGLAKAFQPDATPRSESKQWELRGRGTIAGLFEAVFPLGMASPTGFNPFTVVEQCPG